MASRLYAFVEYDDHERYDAAGVEREPFLNAAEAIDFTNYTMLWGGKDYKFFSALTGIRSDTDPLFPCRGFPPHLSPEARDGLAQYFDPDDPGVGWLTRDEVEAALAHKGHRREDLSLAVNVVLTVMDYLVSQVGQDRVRLVFATS